MQGETNMKKILSVLVLLSFGTLAHAFPVAVTYEAIVFDVHDPLGIYTILPPGGVSPGDPLSGTFYFDTTNVIGGPDEFIRSTNVVDQPLGNAIAHGLFGPDIVDVGGLGPDVLAILNLGGFAAPGLGILLVQAEGIIVEFDFDLLDGFGPDSDPIWIDGDPILGFGALASGLFSEDGVRVAFVDGVVTSLHIESVPEPTTVMLLGLGLAALGFARPRRQLRFARRRLH